jgi:acetyltransferase-like isoleucine patch superfamily enzyme
VKFGQVARRFLIPSFVVTLIYFLKYRCMVSLKAEVELSKLIRFGKGTDISSFVKLKANGGNLEIGKNVSVGTGCFISADTGGVSIGDYTMVGPNSSIIGNVYRYNKLDVPICLQEKTSKGIHIGENVWIGAGSVVVDGARIESGVIVAPNSVVTGKLPENSIAQGNPAKVIFQRR